MVLPAKLSERHQKHLLNLFQEWNTRRYTSTDIPLFLQQLKVDYYLRPLPLFPQKVDYLALTDLRAVIVNSRLPNAARDWAGWTAILVLEGFPPKQARMVSLCAMAPRGELATQPQAGAWLTSLGFTEGMLRQRLSMCEILEI